jgi:hypothetical protein
VAVELLLRATRAQGQMEHDKLNDAALSVIITTDDASLKTTLEIAEGGLKDQFGKELQKWRVCQHNLKEIEANSSQRFKDKNKQHIVSGTERLAEAQFSCAVIEANNFLKCVTTIMHECSMEPPESPVDECPLSLEVVSCSLNNN